MSGELAKYVVLQPAAPPRGGVGMPWVLMAALMAALIAVPILVGAYCPGLMRRVLDWFSADLEEGEE